MTGAMYAAIAGLKGHMQKLSVIGNNIANVNTYGYKAQRTIFQESMYSLYSAGSNGTEMVAGRNPSQLGYGSNIRSIDLDMSTGSFAATGWGLDCMISGDGFFLVGDKDTAEIIDPDDPESLKSLSLSRLGSLYFGPDGYLTDGEKVVYGFSTVVDDAGNKSTSTILAPIRLPKAAANDPDSDLAPGMAVYPTVGDDGTTLEEDDTLTTRVLLDSVSIDPATGRIQGMGKDTDEPVTVGYIALGIVDNPNGVTHQSGPYYKAMDGAGALHIASIGGAVTGFINNDEADPDADDIPDGMRITSAGETTLMTGGLEMSKTDLATEISEMITTQRGYQANTRIITVTDSMLEELVNMKR